MKYIIFFSTLILQIYLAANLFVWHWLVLILYLGYLTVSTLKKRIKIFTSMGQLVLFLVIFGVLAPKVHDFIFNPYREAIITKARERISVYYITNGKYPDTIDGILNELYTEFDCFPVRRIAKNKNTEWEYDPSTGKLVTKYIPGK